MYIENMRMHQVRKLKELHLEPGVLNTEALLLLIEMVKCILLIWIVLIWVGENL